jgi:hypothetical protein
LIPIGCCLHVCGDAGSLTRVAHGAGQSGANFATATFALSRVGEPVSEVLRECVGPGLGAEGTSPASLFFDSLPARQSDATFPEISEDVRTR